MFRKFIAAVMAACIAAGATPLAAQPAPRTEAEATAQLSAWFARLGGWATPFNQLIQEENAFLAELTNGAVKAINYADRGPTKDGAAWGRQWAVEQRATFNRIKAKAAALRAQTLPPAPGFLADSPRIKRILNGMSGLPASVADMVTRDEALVDGVITLVEKASAGDAESGKELGRRIFELNTALFEGQIAIRRAGAGAIEPEHPQSSITDAEIHMFQALIELDRFAIARIYENRGDAAGLATSLRAHADALDRRADEMVTKQIGMAQELRRTPVSGDLDERVNTALETVSRTAQITRDIAAVLRRIANKLDYAKVDVVEVITIRDEILPLVERLNEQTRIRLRALAG